MTTAIEVRRASSGATRQLPDSGWQVPDWAAAPAVALSTTRSSAELWPTTDSGTTAPWDDGAQVWFNAPDLSAMYLIAIQAMNTLATGQFDAQSLRFKLSTTSEALGSQPNAPVVLHPVFEANQGWTLQAHGDDSGDESATQFTQAPDMLLRLGHKLYSQITGLPCVPTAYTLTDPTGTRYSLDAAGKVTAVRFADGAQWLVSNVGIAAVNSADRVDFIRDSQGRIVRATGPADTAGANASEDAKTFVYRYDTNNRLILARNVNANLGAAVNWISAQAGGASPKNQWAGTLQSGTTTTLAFTVREGELASGIQAAGAQAAVIVANESQFADGAVLKREVLAEMRKPVVGCFVAGTLVHTKDGLKPIEQIKVGDWVLSRPENPEEGTATAYKRVSNTFRFENKPVVSLSWFQRPADDPTGEKYGGLKSTFDWVFATPNHPVWVERHGWVAVERLHEPGKKRRVGLLNAEDWECLPHR